MPSNLVCKSVVWGGDGRTATGSPLSNRRLRSAVLVASRASSPVPACPTDPTTGITGPPATTRPAERSPDHHPARAGRCASPARHSPCNSTTRRTGRSAPQTTGGENFCPPWSRLPGCGEFASREAAVDGRLGLTGKPRHATSSPFRGTVILDASRPGRPDDGPPPEPMAMTRVSRVPYVGPSGSPEPWPLMPPSPP